VPTLAALGEKLGKRLANSVQTSKRGPGFGLKNKGASPALWFSGLKGALPLYVISANIWTHNVWAGLGVEDIAQQLL